MKKLIYLALPALATSAAGHGGEDDSAVIKFYAGLAGIELPAKKEQA